MVETYHTKAERCLTTLQEQYDGRISASSPKSLDHRLEDKALIDLINSENPSALSHNEEIAEIERMDDKMETQMEFESCHYRKMVR